MTKETKLHGPGKKLIHESLNQPEHPPSQTITFTVHPKTGIISETQSFLHYESKDSNQI